MSVELSPASTLGFPRPLTQLVKRSLLIHNPHPSPLAFKVKTTAPKQYTVRPNSGRIEAGESVEIQILLQPLQQEPPPHAKCKDKFLVQSAFIRPDEEMKTLGEMWSETERTNKSAIQEQKIKCAYLPAEDGSTGQNGIPEENEEGLATGDTSRFADESFESRHLAHDGLSHWTTAQERVIDPTLFRNGGFSYYEVDKPAQSTPLRQIYDAAPSSPAHATTHDISPPTNTHTTHSTGISLPSMGNPLTSSNNSTTTPREPTQPSNPDPQTTSQPQPQSQPPLPSLTASDIQGSGPSPTNIALEQSLASTTSESDKLNIALREIDKLRNQLAELSGPQVTGLRRRGTGGGEVQAVAGADTVLEKAKEVVAGSNGVPLEVVVGVAVGVFVLTYLFF